jgi:hypothetical protein
MTKHRGIPVDDGSVCTDEFCCPPQVPAKLNTTALVVRCTELHADERAPLDPKVLAQQRREDGNASQLAWDASVDPAGMLRALLEYDPDPAVLLPPARFIEEATRRFTQHGKQVDPTIWNKTMMCCARMLGRADFSGAATFLRHAYTGAGLTLSAQAAYVEMADMVRHFFPVAPQGWDHSNPQPWLAPQGLSRRPTYGIGTMRYITEQ